MFNRRMFVYTKGKETRGGNLNLKFLHLIPTSVPALIANGCSCYSLSLVWNCIPLVHLQGSAQVVAYTVVVCVVLEVYF